MSEHADHGGAGAGEDVEPEALTDAGPSARIDALQVERLLAREAAERRLASRGFAQSPPSAGPGGASNAPVWVGELNVPGYGRVPATVVVPDLFPDALPRVIVARAALPRRIAHHERSGAVCVVPASGVLLDADRPEALVDEALDRATSELARGIAGESDAELQAEWFAYWEPTEFRAITYSICRADGPARRLTLGRVRGPAPLDGGVDLLADSEKQAAAWIAHLGGDVAGAANAFFVPVATAFPPPEFGETWTVRRVRELLNEHCAPADVDALRAYLRVTNLPITLVLSLPEAPAGTGRRLVAVRFEQAGRDTKKEAAKGFRPGHVPPGRILQLVAHSPVTRLNVQRVDAAYLGARGGAAEALAALTVVVVGIGAVGSEVARNLAALGVGTLRLVDGETMAPENVHRHALGVRHVRRNKAEALAGELRGLFPHLRFEALPGRVEDLMSVARDRLLSADVIVVAVGDETLERRLNRVLLGGPPRVHVWVEPLGVGGHALACNVADPLQPCGVSVGCYECLFATDPLLGLVNRSALAAPGQEIRRSLAGCAGSFSPFSALDARRSALEAAELVASVASGELRESALVTWRGDRTTFEDEGFRLSRRAASLASGARTRVRGLALARTECPICGGSRS